MAAQFGKAPLLATHSLHERDMFSDKGLADMLDRYPREAFDLYTMNDDPQNGRRIFRRGRAGDLSGADLLEVIRRGRLWLNLRAVNDHLPEYDALCREMFSDLEAKVPSLKTWRRDCGLLISSPRARVFYHLDIPCVTLWQLRGTKTVYVYPTGQPFVQNEQLEAIVLRESEEEIDYDPAFEAACERFDLTPGTLANWPQTAPHRVDNGDSLNVSLSCEFQTLQSLVYANAIYTNGVLRRRFGKNPATQTESLARLYAKAGLARLMKTWRRLPTVYDKVTPVTFTLDLSKEAGIREISAA